MVLLIIWLYTLLGFIITLKSNIQMTFQLQGDEEMPFMNRAFVIIKSWVELIYDLFFYLFGSLHCQSHFVQSIVQLFAFILIILAKLDILFKVLEINLALVNYIWLILLMNFKVFIVLFNFCLGLFEDFLLEPCPEILSLVHVLYLVLNDLLQLLLLYALLLWLCVSH